MSVLFVDMVGSTARADGADPEDVRDLNQLYYKETRERVERHGGVLEKYIGDAVVAVFGAPLARSDDSERAVRAALSVLEGILELNERHPGLDLEVRAAVCTGEAVVAVDSTPADALVTGDVVNTAARLQNAAPPGFVLVDSETHGLTRRAFDYEEFPPIEAKGKREPILVWLVGKPLAAAGGQASSDTPFVGRDHELLLMSTLWDRAVSAGAPHLISVLGPAGIGKSRLVREFAFKAEKAGGRLLWGRSLPYEEQTPYLAFGEMLRYTAGIFENDPAEMGRAKLATLVDSLFPASEAIETTRYLSLLLGLGLDEPASEAIHLLFAARRSVELLSEQPAASPPLRGCPLGRRSAPRSRRLPRLSRVGSPRRFRLDRPPRVPGETVVLGRGHDVADDPVAGSSDDRRGDLGGRLTAYRSEPLDGGEGG